MARITVSGGGVAPTEYELKAGTMTVGRETGSDIWLENSTVSGYHAKIVTYFQSSYIEDLDSTNGTYVNGRRIRMHTLRVGDTIIIGPYQLQMQPVAAEPAGAPPSDPAAPDQPLTSAPQPSDLAAVDQASEPPLKDSVVSDRAVVSEPPPKNLAAPDRPSGQPLKDSALSDQAVFNEPSPTRQASADAAPAAEHDDVAVAYFKVMVGEQAGRKLRLNEIGPGVRVERAGDDFMVLPAAVPGGTRIRLNNRELAPDGIVLKDMDMLQLGSVWLAYFSA